MTERKIPNIFNLMKMVVLTSFIGFWVENTFKIFRNGYIDNRFMFLPFLIGYGLFITVIGVVIGTPKNPLPLLKKEIRLRAPWNYIVYFVSMALLVTVGELALGFAVEWIAGFRYWDYSRLPLHFTPYTSLFTSLGFGLIITLFMSLVYEPLMHFFEKRLSGKSWNIVSVVMISLLALDFVVSFAFMISTGDKLTIWKIVFYEK